MKIFLNSYISVSYIQSAIWTYRECPGTRGDRACTFELSQTRPHTRHECLHPLKISNVGLGASATRRATRRSSRCTRARRSAFEIGCAMLCGRARSTDSSCSPGSLRDTRSRRRVHKNETGSPHASEKKGPPRLSFFARARRFSRESTFSQQRKSARNVSAGRLAWASLRWWPSCAPSSASRRASGATRTAWAARSRRAAQTRTSQSSPTPPSSLSGATSSAVTTETLPTKHQRLLLPSEGKDRFGGVLLLFPSSCHCAISVSLLPKSTVKNSTTQERGSHSSTRLVRTKGRVSQSSGTERVSRRHSTEERRRRPTDSPSDGKTNRLCCCGEATRERERESERERTRAEFSSFFLLPPGGARLSGAAARPTIALLDEL